MNKVDAEYDEYGINDEKVKTFTDFLQGRLDDINQPFTENSDFSKMLQLILSKSKQGPLTEQGYNVILDDLKKLKKNY